MALRIYRTSEHLLICHALRFAHAEMVAFRFCAIRLATLTRQVMARLLAESCLARLLALRLLAHSRNSKSSGPRSVFPLPPLHTLLTLTLECSLEATTTRMEVTRTPLITMVITMVYRTAAVAAATPLQPDPRARRTRSKPSLPTRNEELLEVASRRCRTEVVSVCPLPPLSRPTATSTVIEEEAGVVDEDVGELHSL